MKALLRIQSVDDYQFSISNIMRVIMRGFAFYLLGLLFTFTIFSEAHAQRTLARGVEALEKEKKLEEALGDVFRISALGGLKNLGENHPEVQPSLYYPENLGMLSGKSYLIRFFRNETPSSMDRFLSKGDHMQELEASFAIKFGDDSVEIIGIEGREVSPYVYRKTFGNSSIPCFRSKILPSIKTAVWRNGYAFTVAQALRDEDLGQVLVFGAIDPGGTQAYIAGIGLLEEISDEQIVAFIEEERKAKNSAAQDLNTLRATGEPLPNLDHIDFPDGNSRSLFAALYEGKPYNVYSETTGDPSADSFNTYLNDYITGMMFLSYHGMLDKYCDLSNLETTQFTTTRQVFAGSDTTYLPWLNGGIIAQTTNHYNTEVVEGPNVQNYAYPTFVSTVEKTTALNLKIVFIGPEGMSMMQRQVWLQGLLLPYVNAMKSILDSERCSSPTWRKLGEGLDIVAGIKASGKEATIRPLIYKSPEKAKNTRSSNEEEEELPSSANHEAQKTGNLMKTGTSSSIQAKSPVAPNKNLGKISDRFPLSFEDALSYLGCENMGISEVIQQNLIEAYTQKLPMQIAQSRGLTRETIIERCEREYANFANISEKAPVVYNLHLVDGSGSEAFIYAKPDDTDDGFFLLVDGLLIDEIRRSSFSKELALKHYRKYLQKPEYGYARVYAPLIQLMTTYGSIDSWNTGNLSLLVASE